MIYPLFRMEVRGKKVTKCTDEFTEQALMMYAISMYDRTAATNRTRLKSFLSRASIRLKGKQ